MMLFGASPLSRDGGSLETASTHRKAASDKPSQIIRDWSSRFANGGQARVGVQLLCFNDSKAALAATK